MRFSGRRPDWQNGIKSSPAAVLLRENRLDHFPSAELRQITNNFLGFRSSFNPFSTPVQPHTRECDEVLTSELESLQDCEWPLRNIGLIATVHVLTGEQARAQLHLVRPDFEAEHVHEAHVRVYCQTLRLVSQAQRSVVFQHELGPVDEILNILEKQDGDFLSVCRLLRTVDENRQDLLPFDFVERILLHLGIRHKIESQFRQLEESQNWHEAYKTLIGFREVARRDRVWPILRLIFANYAKWAAWRPNPGRIWLWDQFLVGPARQRLKPVLLLEGPDPEHQARYGCSNPRLFDADGPQPTQEDMQLMERLLSALDLACELGQQSIELLIVSFIESGRHDRQTLQQVEVVLSYRNENTSRIVAEYLRAYKRQSVDAEGLRQKMAAMTNILPLLESLQPLRDVFPIGNVTALAGKTLTDAQSLLCLHLHQNLATIPFALTIQAFGWALKDAAWLHSGWQPAYVDMLHRIPAAQWVQATMDQMRRSTRDAEAYKESLNYYLCSIQRKVQTSGPSPQEDVPVLSAGRLFDDRIWFTTTTTECLKLRKVLKAIDDIEVTLATTCAKQAEQERVTFVKELLPLLIADSDQACVNLAESYGRRLERDIFVHECWKSLLLHKMKHREVGLMDRLGVRLSPPSWQRWTVCLGLIYQDLGHLEPGGVVGFTKERFDFWTRKKGGLRRGYSGSGSTRATSAVSSLTEDGTPPTVYSDPFADQKT